MSDEMSSTTPQALVWVARTDADGLTTLWRVCERLYQQTHPRNLPPPVIDRTGAPDGWWFPLELVDHARLALAGAEV